MDFSSPKIEEHMRFICPECGVELPTQIIWRKHLNNLHDYNKKTVDVFNFKEINERYHECNECHKWVANGNQSITTLQYHRISHLPFNLTFKCRHCVKAFARKRALCEHLLNEHEKLLAHTSDKKHVEVNLVQSTPKPAPSSFDEMMMNDLEKNKKDPGDLIQKALLDSLIDLENETLSEFTKNNTDINEFALNQSLNDLEAILKGDLEQQSTVQQFNMQQPQNQFSIQYTDADTLDIEDNELLEQICADIFEEVLEPVPSVSKDTKTKQIQPIDNFNKYTSSHTQIKIPTRNDWNDEPDERLISIEINAVNESERKEMFTSPKRKRLKLDVGSRRTAEMDAKIKLLLETYILYICPECGREFKTQSSWRDHVFKVHDLTNTMYAKFKNVRNGAASMCLDCKQVLYTTKTHELQRHRFTHMPFQSYLKCTFCSKTRSSKPKMIQHLQDFHASSWAHKTKSKPTHFKCADCCKSFQTHIRWQHHRQSCTPRRITKSKNSNDSNISNNLNLIAHLKKMRARMRSLISTDNTEAKNSQRNNYSV